MLQAIVRLLVLLLPRPLLLQRLLLLQLWPWRQFLLALLLLPRLLLSLLLLLFLLLLLKRLLLPLIVVRLLQRRQQLQIRWPMDCHDCHQPNCSRCCQASLLIEQAFIIVGRTLYIVLQTCQAPITQYTTDCGIHVGERQCTIQKVVM